MAKERGGQPDWNAALAASLLLMFSDVSVIDVAYGCQTPEICWLIGSYAVQRMARALANDDGYDQEKSWTRRDTRS